MNDFYGQMPMSLKRSVALRYRPEALWDAGQHHETIKPSNGSRFTGKARNILSGLRPKFLRTTS